MLALCGCASADYTMKSLSIKQGIKYDDPESPRDIPTFIESHRLDVDEILDPIDSFSKYPFCLQRNIQ
jgi:phosphatidylserine decarboxylase